jgi:hypothetical protein
LVDADICIGNWRIAFSVYIEESTPEPLPLHLSQSLRDVVLSDKLPIGEKSRFGASLYIIIFAVNRRK